jgi:hypothetical protein
MQKLIIGIVVVMAVAAVAIFLIQPDMPTGSVIQGSDEVSACITKCTVAKTLGEDLSNGPCLSNSIVEGWVCDVVHDPRIDSDDLPENQCSGFGTTAEHFVEVDLDCNLIRVQ